MWGWIKTYHRFLGKNHWQQFSFLEREAQRRVLHHVGAGGQKGEASAAAPPTSESTESAWGRARDLLVDRLEIRGVERF